MKAGDHNPTKIEFWADHIAKWRSSGLIQRDYCAQQGLGLRNFVRWKKIVEKGSSDTQLIPRARRAKAHQRLIPIAVIPDVSGGHQLSGKFPDAGVQLHAHGYVIGLSVGFHAGTLQALLGALG